MEPITLTHSKKKGGGKDSKTLKNGHMRKKSESRTEIPNGMEMHIIR